MAIFQVLRPADLPETLAFLQQYQGKCALLAGGTDLLVQLRSGSGRHSNLEYVIDLSSVGGLDQIERNGNNVVLGPMVTHARVASSAFIQEKAYLLAQSCSTVGSPQIRNRGTLGGGICNASPASDIVPPLIALEASVKIESSGNCRFERLEKLFDGPYLTQVGPNEMITQISFPYLTDKMKSAYYKVGRRKALAIARLDLAVIAQQNEAGLLTDIRIAPGAVFDSFDRASNVEQLLKNQIPTKPLILKAATALEEEMIQRAGIRWSTEYKKPVVETVAKRLLCQVLEVK